MKKITQSTLPMVLIFSVFTTMAANPEPIMFGTVTHSNGESTTGSLRWGDQETFLSDIFNGEKLMTTGIEHLSADEKEQLIDHQPGPKARIGDLEITFKSFFSKEIDMPLFNVPFGAIKRIDHKDGVFTITLHDGSSFQSNDEHNDTRDDIYVLSTEGQTSEFEIEDLSSIVFSAAPTDAKSFDKGIYGTVTSEIGTFQGRIMWDKDERTMDKELDGNDESQEHEIKFAQIKSIEKVNNGNASKVQLKDGKTLTLNGTNDVNNSNRGIWIDNPDLGRIEISWQQFSQLNIESVDVDWLTFDDYVTQAKQLSGTVVLHDDKQIKAKALTFDLNQQSEAELLHVDVNGSNRQIPLKLIETITKKHDQAVELRLRDQSQLLAHGNRSVTQENNGLMVLADDQNKWYPWKLIKAIILD